MVASGPPATVPRPTKQILITHSLQPGQTQGDLSSRIDPVSKQPTPRPGYGSDRSMWNHRCEQGGDQIGVPQHTPIFEVMNQSLGGPGVFEGGDQTHAARKDTLVGGIQMSATLRAQPPSTRSMATLAEHVAKLRAESDRFRLQAASCKLQALRLQA